jgi:cytoskeletal protein CcmA (bactofilin family)
MFSKGKKEIEVTRPASSRNPPSIISASLRIVGNLVSDGDIQVDGTVDGDVQSRSLTVSQGAAVNGGIAADSVRIDGAVNGHIRASNVMLGPTARVLGDIIHTSLVIEAGAFIEGHCRRMESEPAPMVAPVAVAASQEDTPIYGAAS